MKSRIHIVLLMLIIATSAMARPARHGLHIFTQPDGTTFEGRCYGDEFFKVKTTSDGHGIIRQEDGWWCYVRYSADGTRESTGYRVGSAAPQSVLHESCKAVHSGRRYRVRPQSYAVTRAAETNVRHALIILASYSDVDFKYTKADFVNLLTQEGYAVNGATGCAKEYFDTQFNGTVDFIFDVTDIVKLDNMREYYGANDRAGNDKRPAEMVRDACLKIDQNTDINFADYDDNGDFIVDNVFVFYAGGDESEQGSKEEYIWSHAWSLSDAGLSLKLDGVTIDSYACTSELRKNRSRYVMCGIGTFCHEYSHTLGLPDLYDTDYDDAGGWAAGLWLSTSLMDGGNDNNSGNTPPYYNAIEREFLGLTTPGIIRRNGRYTLKPIGTSGECYKIATDDEDEYFLLECRFNDGWDKHIGGSGMLVYHIDRSDEDVWDIYNTVNAVASHQCADLLEADARVDYFNSEDDYYNLISSIKGVFFPYGSDSITQNGQPSLKLWNGKSTGITITHIEHNADGSITFSVSGFDGEEPPMTNKINVTAFPDAALITFESDIIYDGEATVVWGETGQEDNKVRVSPYEPGKYSLLIDGLTPGNKSYTVSVYFEIGDMMGIAKEASFLTTRSPSVSWPFIHMVKEGISSRDTGRILMRVYNAAEAEEIRWFVNGNETSPAPDGYFTFKENSTVRAEVYWSDGSTDILEKTITVNKQR